MIKLSQLSIGHAETQRVIGVLKSGQIAQGRLVEEFESSFAHYCGSKYAIAFNSGTAAIHAALYALGIGPGDEVIAPPFTFIATVSPVLMVGAKVVFADIRKKDFCLDPAEVERKITSKTKAVIPVDLYGQIYPYEQLQKLTKRFNLKIIEDACQAVGAQVDGHKAGTFGDAAAFSLYATKNITCGEGGVLTTNDPLVVEKAKLIRHHGQSETERYEYYDLGFNYRMTEIQAAIALEQLKKADRLNDARISNAKTLSKGLSGIPGLIIPRKKEGTKHVFHQYTVRITPKFRHSRQALIDHLDQKGIGVGVYYPKPLHLTSLFSKMGYVAGDFPVAESMSNQVLSLPVHPLLRPKDIDLIITTIRNYAS